MVYFLYVIFHTDNKFATEKQFFLHWYKMNSKSLFSLVALAAFASAGASTEGISVERLGRHNTFVRVDTDKAPFLLIPVEEAQDDSRVNIIVDGKPAGTFYVRLAEKQTDFQVPFDLTPYKGKNLILDFNHKESGRQNGSANECIGWEELTLSDTFDTSNREKLRPRYHHTPLYGWMNDPNGMFYKDGKWHLYYQWNPYGSKWQNMTWGHAVSSDLINWEMLPAAITPDALGAIFSGSAAVDHTGSAGFGKDAVVAMYTTAGHSQMQSIAHSDDDGLTFEVFPGNPVITMDSEARDPKIFWNEATGQWNMVLAHALDHEILFFSSPDLKNWTQTDAFGKIGATGGVWECPDLFQLEVDGTGEKKWVLIVNLNPGGPFGGSATQYFIGDFDGKKFTPLKNSNGEIVTKWMDYGKDHYATVTWSDAPDGRHVALGWMSNWEYADRVPTTQYRSGNTIPRDLKLFKAPDGELYIASSPSPELLSIRGNAVAKAAKFNVSSKGKKFNLPKQNDGICEITADIQAPKDGSVAFTLSNSAGEKVVISYDEASHLLKFDRSNGTLTDIAPSFPAVTEAPTFETDGKLSLRIFVDNGSIEVFGNDGQSVMTNLTFPVNPYTVLNVTGSGKTVVENLKIYELNP